MSKIGIVIGREYFTRVRKKSFIFLTILSPLLIVVLMTLPIIIGRNSVAKETVAVIDPTGQYLAALESTDKYTFVKATRTLQQYQAEWDQEQEITAVLEIKGDLLQNPRGASLSSARQLPSGIEEYVNSSLSSYLTRQKLAAHNIPGLEEMVRESQVNLSVSTYKWSEDGTASQTSSTLSSMIGLVLTMVIFIFITTYGSLVMAGVLEEKKSRIMEVMLASVKPFELMMGKIVGIGLVGLTQVFIWILFGVLLFVGVSLLGLGAVYDPGTLAGMSPDALAGMGSMGSMGLSADNIAQIQDLLGVFQGINFFEITLLFLLYFVGGFMIYSSLFAGVGASISGDEDSNQFMTPIMLILMIAFYAAFGSIENPEGPLAFWGSMIPFTSPIVMMVRLPYGVPLWQEILSVALLYATFVGIVWLSAKIYRVGVLLYGKKPSYADLWRWIRHA